MAQLMSPAGDAYSKEFNDIYYAWISGELDDEAASSAIESLEGAEAGIGATLINQWKSMGKSSGMEPGAKAPEATAPEAPPTDGAGTGGAIPVKPISDTTKAVGKTFDTAFDTTKPTALTQDFYESAPGAYWQKQLGIPGIGANPYQEWLQSQFSPAWATTSAQNLLAPFMKGSAPTPFSQYADVGNFGGVGKGALSALQTASGLGGSEQQAWMDDLSLAAGEGGLQNLMQAALRGKGYASPFASIMARHTPGLQNEWESQTAGGGVTGSPTYLKFLMSKLGF